MSALLSLVLVAVAQLKPWPMHPVPAGQVKALDGREYQLPAPQAKATVVLFITVDCPICNRYAPEISRIVSKYGKQVAFFLAYTDPTVGASAMKKHGKDFRLAVPAFNDSRHIWVDKIGAAVTPEAAVLSPKGKLLYRGRIDDLYLDPSNRKPKADKFDLRTALDETLAGKPVSDPMVLPVGCAIGTLH